MARTASIRFIPVEYLTRDFYNWSCPEIPKEFPSEEQERPLETSRTMFGLTKHARNREQSRERMRRMRARRKAEKIVRSS